MNTTLTDANPIVDRIRDRLLQDLHIEVPSDQADLIENGCLDSLAFLQTITLLEDEFNISIMLEDLSFDEFRSLESMSRFVERKMQAPSR